MTQPTELNARAKIKLRAAAHHQYLFFLLDAIINVELIIHYYV